MTEPTLEFITAQLARVLDEQRDMREQMVMLTGMVLRIDGGVTALLAQGRLHERRFAQLEGRTALEEAGD